MQMHLAQINVATLQYAREAPEMADFVAALDNVNALADRSEGFVWRLIGDGGEDATNIRVEGAPELLINMSVWSSIEALRNFVYQTAHAAVMARRAKWFPTMSKPHLALWWIPAGTIPSLTEAFEKLRRLEAHGPTPESFTFEHAFSADRAPMQLPQFKKHCA